MTTKNDVLNKEVSTKLVVQPVAEIEQTDAPLYFAIDLPADISEAFYGENIGSVHIPCFDNSYEAHSAILNDLEHLTLRLQAAFKEAATELIEEDELPTGGLIIEVERQDEILAQAAWSVNDFLPIERDGGRSSLPVELTEFLEDNEIDPEEAVAKIRENASDLHNAMIAAGREAIADILLYS